MVRATPIRIRGVIKFETPFLCPAFGIQYTRSVANVGVVVHVGVRSMARGRVGVPLGLGVIDGYGVIVPPH